MRTLAVWTHDLDSIAIQLGPLAVRWYGLAYLAGFVIAALALQFMAKRGWVRFPRDKAIDLVLAIGLFGVFVGGRLGYVLFYRPDLLVDFSGDLPFWGVLRVHEGGMASHGGMIGVLLVLWWSARRMRTSMLHLLDAICLVAPAGLFLGRIANFINGELLGKIIRTPAEMEAGATAPAIGMRFPQELIERPEELVWSEGQFFDATIIAQVPPNAPIDEIGGRVYSAWLDPGIDPAVREMIEPLLSVRHPSQLYQAVAEGLVVGLALWWVWRKPRRDGVILSWFLIVYGIGRIATEFWRLPDAHLGDAARIAGLSRGQWLSALMVVGGVALLAWIKRRGNAPTSGGWLAGAGKSPALEGSNTGPGDALDTDSKAT